MKRREVAQRLLTDFLPLRAGKDRQLNALDVAIRYLKLDVLMGIDKDRMRFYAERGKHMNEGLALVAKLCALRDPTLQDVEDVLKSFA